MKKALTAMVLVLLLAPALFAQSSYIEHGRNGVLFDLQASVTSEQVVGGMGGRVGMSIGGVMDIGADFSVVNGEVASEDSQETNIGIRYGVMVLKQGDSSPVSFTMGGTYGYSYIASDYYDTNSLQKEGQGYTLFGELTRELVLANVSLFRVGLVGQFRSYNYAIRYVTQETSDNQEYTPSRETAFSWGGVASVGIITGDGSTYYVEGSPTVNQDGEFSLMVRSGMVFNLD